MLMTMNSVNYLIDGLKIADHRARKKLSEYERSDNFTQKQVYKRITESVLTLWQRSMLPEKYQIPPKAEHVKYKSLPLKCTYFTIRREEWEIQNLNFFQATLIFTRGKEI